MYLHYRWTTKTLETELDRACHRAHIAEYRSDEIKKQIRCSRGKQVKRLKREYKIEISRAQRNLLVAEKIEEELEWRERPEALVTFYQEHGYKLIYLCGHGEFDTVEQALAEARTVHALNDACLELGADGSYVEDLVPPEEMIQIAFVERSKQ